MTLSYSWLKQYIDIPESPEQLASILTSTGLEVESVEPFETVKGGLRGLVIGEVLTCVKHPNADKLSLTTVDVGAGRILPIVCGAANVAAGQKVVVALSGSTVHPTAGEPFQIKSARIRGEVSEGMICAEDEIGLGASHEGILVLPANAPVGKPAAEFFQIESDYQLEIGLTPNRADAASHIGAARDIKAATGRDIRWPSIDNFKPDNQALSISVAVENTEACPRYSGVTLSGVTVKESPAWLKNRLLSIGLTPINNVVDITNFVLHETGQPLHAFDADQIRGGQIVVKTLPAGTTFVTLDGKERKLSSNDLMICDREAGLCIAGVFGGLNSGISDKTKNIFLESACFAPSYVRKTGQLHQLKTDASFRFERGTDPNLTVYALKRAALLIRELAGGTISSDVVDVYPTKIQNRKIEVSYANINRLIGKVLPAARIHTILQSLDIEVMQATSQGFSASVPPYRVDVTQEADIVEEILRIYGFNNIELSEIAGTDYLAAFPEKASHTFTHTLGEMLSGQGFYEILTNSLTRQAYQQRLNLSYGSEPVEVLNKLSEEQGILRQTLLFTGLEVLSHNINRKQKDIRLYEFGKVYGKTPTGYREEDRLALYISGNAEAENWRRPAQPAGYFDLAQAVVNVLQRCGISCEQRPVRDSQLEYGMALWTGQQEIGRLGKVKAALCREAGVKQDVFFADLSVDLLFSGANPRFDVKEIPRFPEVRRDLSLVLDQQVTFAEIESLVRTTEKKLIRDIIAFDVYEGEKIPPGKKAYALGFTLLDETKTLTDEEIDKTMNRLMAAFEKQMSAVIRK